MICTRSWEIWIILQSVVLSKIRFSDIFKSDQNLIYDICILLRLFPKDKKKSSGGRKHGLIQNVELRIWYKDFLGDSVNSFALIMSVD